MKPEAYFRIDIYTSRGTDAGFIALLLIGFSLFTAILLITGNLL